MTVMIEPEVEEWIARKVSAGEYASAEKMVSEAVRRLVSEREGTDALTQEAAFSVWSPYEAHEAAAALSAFLERERDART